MNAAHGEIFVTKRVLIWVFVLVAVFVLGRPSPSLAAQRRIAVLDFRNTSRHQGLIWLSQAVPETLVTKLAGVSSIHVIERGQLEKIIKEQRLGLMDLFDPSKAAKIGRLAGAQVVVIGGYVVFGKGLMFNLRFVDAETGIVLHTAQVRGGTSDEDALFGTLTRLADAAVESLGKKVVIRGGEKRVVKAPPVTLTPRERKRLAAPPAKSLTAYELYGKGLEAYKKNHWREADALYARALQRDPALADAAGWRARVLGDLGRYAEALGLNARTLTLYRKKRTMRTPPPSSTTLARSTESKAGMKRHCGDTRNQSTSNAGWETRRESPRRSTTWRSFVTTRASTPRPSGCSAGPSSSCAGSACRRRSPKGTSRSSRGGFRGGGC